MIEDIESDDDYEEEIENEAVKALSNIGVAVSAFFPL